MHIYVWYKGVHNYKVFALDSFISFIGISCVTYTPTGFCKNFQSVFDYPVKIAVNTSHGGDISTSQKTADNFHYLLTKGLPVHKQCLNELLPFICRWVFPPCDPAFNVSVEQYVCRRSCEILTNFVCNEICFIQKVNMCPWYVLWHFISIIYKKD